MVLAVIGLVVALQLSLASFPTWQVLVVVGGVAALLLLIFVPVWQVRNLQVDCPRTDRNASNSKTKRERR